MCHCLTGDSPSRRPTVSCRMSTYDAWFCVCVCGGGVSPGEVDRVEEEKRTEGQWCRNESEGQRVFNFTKCCF